ncbi:MAG: signal recognition particle receptor subunit alpha, partial [Terriglobia bacterium]
MFDALQEKFQTVFKSLRLQGVLTEEAVDETLGVVRLALLEADVNLKVVKELLDRVRLKALSQDARATLTPDQEIIRIVRD